MFLWIMGVLAKGGYLGIIVLMAMESSIFPIPSELVIPPAAFWASQGKMSYAGVILAGTFGCWLGASITYWISYFVGRPILVRYGKYFFVPEAKLVLAEQFIQNYGRDGVFFARLLPVVRHLIGIPAGLMRMNFWTFSWTTIVGSAIWCAVLAWFGPRIITPEMFVDPDSMVKALKHKTHMVALLVGLVAVLYGLMRWMASKRKPVSTS